MNARNPRETVFLFCSGLSVKHCTCEVVFPPLRIFSNGHTFKSLLVILQITREIHLPANLRRRLLQKILAKMDQFSLLDVRMRICSSDYLEREFDHFSPRLSWGSERILASLSLRMFFCSSVISTFLFG